MKPIRLWLASLFCLIASLVPRAVAQQAYYLAIEGEGTASVIISADAKTAIIIDGGHPGVDGITSIKLNDEPLLLALKKVGVEEIVIACSHPHSDHLGGLVELVSGDAVLATFKSVTFIDSGFNPGNSNREASLSLSKEYQFAQERLRGAAIDKGMDVPITQRVEYRSASNTDAFGSLLPSGKDVEISNFKYDAGSGKHPHGHSILTRYRLTDTTTGAATCVLDPDDANTTLVRRWAAWANEDAVTRRVDCLIAPHHGSALTDISPLLAEAIRPKVVIFTVNAVNQYGHPAPTILKQCMDVVGIENIHFTGAGEHVEIGPKGVLPRKDPNLTRELFNRFVRKQGRVIKAELDELVLRESAGAKLSKSEESKLKRLRESWDAVQDIAKKMGGDLTGGDDPLGEIPPKPTKPSGKGPGSVGNGEAESKSGGPNNEPGGERPTSGPENSPGGGGSGGGGGGGGNQVTPERDGGPSRPPAPNSGHNGTSPGTPSTSGTSDRTVSPSKPSASPHTNSGRFSELSSRVNQAVARTGPKALPRTPGVKATQRATRFTVSRSGIPIAGGIVLGNVASETIIPVGARILPETGGSWRIEIDLKDNTSDKAVYGGITQTELWVAHSFVAPDEAMTKAFDLPEGECTLIGMMENHGGVWDFAMHPAIANTTIALAAMRLDMTPTALRARDKGERDPDMPAVLRNADFSTYQWYDAPLRIASHDGKLVLKPSDTGPEELALRLRLWGSPPWLVAIDNNGDRSQFEIAIVNESLARLQLQMKAAGIADHDMAKIQASTLGTAVKGDRDTHEARWKSIEDGLANTPLKDKSWLESAKLLDHTWHSLLNDGETTRVIHSRAETLLNDVLDAELRRQNPGQLLQPNQQEEAREKLFEDIDIDRALAFDKSATQLAAYQLLAERLEKEVTPTQAMQAGFVALKSLIRARTTLATEQLHFTPPDWLTASAKGDMQEAIQARLEAIVAEQMAEMDVSLREGVQAQLLTERAVAEVYLETQGVSTEAPPEVLKYISQQSDAVHSIDRLARLVAVLNWLEDHQLLPAFPKDAEPIKLDVRPSFPMDAVLEAHP